MDDSTALEQIAQLSKKIDKLEYNEIATLKEKHQELEVALATNSLLTESNTKAMEKMSETMDKVSITMVQLSHGIEQSNKVSQELTVKVDKLEDKFDAIDDKSKFDIMAYLKSNWITIVMNFAIIGYLILKK